jgi:hypothetical protein
VNDGLPARAAQVVGDAPPRAAVRAVADWIRDDGAGAPGSTGVQTSAPEAWDRRPEWWPGRDHSDVPPLRDVYHGAPSPTLGSPWR